jgi:hypothetical protein
LATGKGNPFPENILGWTTGTNGFNAKTPRRKKMAEISQRDYVIQPGVDRQEQRR